MQITTTFRHLEPSDALKSYAEEKLERIKKYIDDWEGRQARSSTDRSSSPT